jgi:Protein phosphatase 2C
MSIMKIDVAERAGLGLDGQPRPSEDVVVVLPNAVAVLDGATALLPGRRSGGWYASRLAGQLAGRLAGYPDMELADLLAAAIQALTREHGLVAGESPASTVAIVRWSAETVEALVLGDSPVVAVTEDGPQVLADERLASLPRTGPGYRARLRDGGGYGDAHLAALRTSAERVDRLRNTEGGYWVAEANPDAAYHAVRAHWPRAEVRQVLVASDGVSCGIDDYRLLDWPAAVDLVSERGAQAMLDTVRAAEESDPHGTRWPRAKPHDDQALAVIDFERD